MARSYEEQLDAVDAAIEKIEEGAQTVFVGNGKSYTYGDLGRLYAERRRLEMLIRRGSGNRIPVRGVTPYV